MPPLCPHREKIQTKSPFQGKGVYGCAARLRMRTPSLALPPTRIPVRGERTGTPPLCPHQEKTQTKSPFQGKGVSP